MIQILLVGYILLITALSLIPTPVASSGLYSDKIEHLIAYAVMGALGFFSVKTREKRINMFVVITGIGIILEIFQIFVPGRYASFLDILANTLGALIGYFIGWLILISFKKNTEELSC